MVEQMDGENQVHKHHQGNIIKNNPRFSAVCFTFGTYLNKRLGVPVGLIHSSVGGSPIQMWMSKEAHRECNGAQPEANYWNSMIYPALRQKIVGGLWYQGESNAGNSKLYHCQYTAMVKDWRKMFSSNILFLAVQLAGYRGEFREIRNVQYNLGNEIPHSGMATAIDLGDPTDM
jgi:sialate O-acetylesterase